jgi:hypothetical protein
MSVYAVSIQSNTQRDTCLELMHCADSDEQFRTDNHSEVTTQAESADTAIASCSNTLQPEYN